MKNQAQFWVKINTLPADRGLEQGNRLKPGVGPGRDLPGSRAGAVPDRSRTPLPGPFPARDDPRIGAGDGAAGATAGAGGDESMNAT